MTSNIQSNYFIVATYSYDLLKFVYAIGSAVTKEQKKSFDVTDFYNNLEIKNCA